MSIPDLTNKNFIDRAGRHKVFGVAVAVVTDNKDPDKLYRVKVRYPWLDNGAKTGGEQSYWARISTIGAGKDRGIYFLPEVEDEVLVAFEHGDMNRPFIVGALWNKDQKNYEDHDSGKNDRRTFKSRLGHFLEFEDGAKKVTLKTAGGHILCMDDAAKTIEMKTSGGDFCKMEDSSKITLKTGGDMLLDAAATMTLKCATLKTDSSGASTIKAGSTLDMKAGSAFTLKGGATGLVKSGAALTIKGSVVNIN